MNLLSRNATVNALIWSLPAGPEHCAGFVGGARSVCRSCYAGAGMHWMPGSLRANAERAAWFRDGQGVTEHKVSDMVRAVGRARFVVVHESGDFAAPWEIEFWRTVALDTPDTRYWVRTRTWHLGALWRAGLRALHALPNVTVRLSALQVNDRSAMGPKADGFPSSSVTDRGPGCPKQRHGSCHRAGCRACWDKDIAHVTYALHGDAVQRKHDMATDWKRFSEKQRQAAMEV